MTRAEAETSLATLRTDYERLQAEIKSAQAAAEELSAASPKGKRGKRGAKGSGKGFGSRPGSAAASRDEDADGEGDGATSGAESPALAQMLLLLEEREAQVTVGTAALEEANKKLEEAVERAKVCW